MDSKSPRILLLGGSNTGIRNGWARQLLKFMPHAEIHNKYLGGVGSLYGLLQLLKLKKEGLSAPDLVVFEYTLNDTLVMLSGGIDAPLLKTVIDEVATFCARENIGLLFLCLSLPPQDGEKQSVGSRFVDELYKSIADKRGVDCIFQADIIGRVSAADYIDPLHLSEEASKKISEAVAHRIGEGAPRPNGEKKTLSFGYLDSADAAIHGAARQQICDTPVFTGPLIRLERGGRSYWAFSGQLAALVIRSTRSSGYYQIRIDAKCWLKNAQVSAREILPNIVTMQ